jgi:hypothetical protein
LSSADITLEHYAPNQFYTFLPWFLYNLVSKVVIFFSKNKKLSGASKLIDIKYFIVRDKVKDDTIIIQYINTRFMLADSLTKLLPPTLYKEHVASMSLVNVL